MTRAEKVAEARRLRAEGLTYREIGERMGVPLQTASSWVLDPELSGLRARKLRYGGICEVCGAPTDGSRGRGQAPRECRTCVIDRINAERAVRAAAIDLEVAELRRQGYSNEEIGAMIGTSQASVASRVYRMREMGLDVARTTYGPAAARSMR